jgi:hypothetical protein
MPKIAVLMILIFPFASLCAQPPELANNRELSLHGGFDFQGPSGDNIDLEVGYGWFLRDDLLVGGEFRWSLIEDIAPGENDYRSQQASLVVEKLFIGDSNMVPYIGGEIGFRNSKFDDADESALVLGGRLGGRFFLNETITIDASISFLTSDKQVFIVDFEAEDQYLYPRLGIKAVFE